MSRASVWGEFPDEVCILIENSVVVEVGQNDEALGCWMRLLPILDNGGNELFFSLCRRLHLLVYQEGNRAYRHQRGNDSSRAYPSSWSHAAPYQGKHPTLQAAKGSMFPESDLLGQVEHNKK